eukprot:s113_g25.t1
MEEQLISARVSLSFCADGISKMDMEDETGNRTNQFQQTCSLSSKWLFHVVTFWQQPVLEKFEPFSSFLSLTLLHNISR